jgi:phosphodiesterase/alkaline phosphatase D-like protein
MTTLQTGPLVRAISTHSAVIWAELTEPGNVTVTAFEDENTNTQQSVSGPTTTVGGRHYVALQLTSLRPATWYNYTLTYTANLSNQHTLEAGQEPDQAGEILLPQSAIPTIPIIQCFRTIETTPESTSPGTLRIAYGSCRKAESGKPDAFNTFGHWLLDHKAERNDRWPHIMLLIGDQIYADEPPTNVVNKRPAIAQGARNYEDFACLYQYAWTHDYGAQQALAVIPSYMIFDDHEITNNWNSAPDWRAQALQAGEEQILVDGLVAYWVYQDWGNIDPKSTTDHPLLSIMRQATESGEDALIPLRERIRADVYNKQPLRWHYTIPTHPPIFVANARTERTAIFQSKDDDLYAPTRIISEQQMNELQEWFEQHQESPTILVSSVPILLPPAIGAIEYATGQRLWHQLTHPLHWLGRQLARLQLFIADKGSFDHWPLYALSWQKIIELFQQRKNDTFILSGDVHFSYALEAHTSSKQHIYQLVSTPLQNELSTANKREIQIQSYLTSWNYGGLHHQILALQNKVHTTYSQRNLLYANTIALLTIQTQSNTSYTYTHEYLGIDQDTMQVIGQTLLPEK